MEKMKRYIYITAQNPSDLADKMSEYAEQGYIAMQIIDDISAYMVYVAVTLPEA